MRKARKIRERLGLSLGQVYRKTDIDSSALSKFERGIWYLGVPNLQKLAALYGCTIDELLADAEADPTEPEPVPA